ncbi:MULTISPECIES: TrmH family RNA methyltransferase [Lysinibacillus]|uniref:TrmH family RNA methyltransferase n=1 Tax=Lysinibacillus TaxID=400634 RepID=UPI00214AD539|nr:MULTISPECIES: RNA methyltransferase [Lysinibacillus]UNT56814.1 RNA methyltransferase [Lysinibacillus capsici]UUV23323.1 RNA methyltransferase [Lysinibacillus sp. FN11]UYB46189.1 RNA methyltransferase [Lysinibacillus capsici]WHP41783.1 RNA methyltransferase [Lysinibacillus boronitolerans]
MKRIESTQNALVKYWKKLATTRKERERSGEFLVEGFHLVEEALKNKKQVLQIIVREGIDLPMLWPIDDVAIVEVSTAVAKEFAETETSQGVFAVCKQPVLEDNVMTTWRKVLLIDAVQDPGNIGTMIRTADAAGLDAVILGKGCADLYNPKTLRAAQGSHFHIPVVRGDLADWIDILQGQGVPVFGTALDEEAVPYSDIQHTGAFAIIMGNEGSGIQPQLLAMTDQNMIIPLFGQAESLNVAVATGIVLYGFAK